MQRQRFNLIRHHLTRLRIGKRNDKAIQRSVLPLNGSQLDLELVDIMLYDTVHCLDDGLLLELVEFVDDVLGEAG